jgi:hypothetical protein
MAVGVFQIIGAIELRIQPAPPLELPLINSINSPLPQFFVAPAVRPAI